ncbi:hypothetical protein L873DRAFT_1807194 [Choiromyces venosus 120613-1]|uniref:Uncharacterized protein n=1 Tax=Choiromyces venosus 120613-1 TaxID=1336337 RepID=A0A3N4JSZ2_9PEZI|nr:hypothetical protein L873DRAFT_1807194 [Choiromyces venosus 120613-1]
MESLIVRLMPGTPHDNASWSFYTFYSPEQGDRDFKPNDARASEGEWTPLVVGVGYSGSLPALQCDAQQWLENSGG